MKYSVCFIGHRKINDTAKLRKRLQDILTELIDSGTVNFIFGDHSAFNALCYELVTELKKEHPAIKRIHFRKDYEDTNDYTMRFLISGYEKSICPKGVGNAGRASYAERNRAMICESDVCIFYYDKTYLPSLRGNSRCNLSDYQPHSGTAIAYAYAEQKGKLIYNLFP